MQSNIWKVSAVVVVIALIGFLGFSNDEKEAPTIRIATNPWTAENLGKGC